LICTVARGGGDLTFAHLAAAALARSPRVSLSAVCVAQAGLDPTAAAAALLPLLPAGVPLLACFSRDAANELRAVPLPCALPPPPARAFSAVVQGPLHLFGSAAEAGRALGVPLRAAPPPAFLSLREFGQGRFLPPSAPPALVHASAGLAGGEWGVWAEPAVGAPAAGGAPRAPAAGAAFVSHFHTEEHGGALGRLVASVLLLAQLERGGGGGGGGEAVVAAPLGSHGALLRGLASHPGVAAVGGEGARLQLAPAHAPAARLALRVEAARALPRPAFLRALAACDGALLTGDASVNEALALCARSGAPFLYSAEGHKAFFAEALVASLPPLLRAFWAFAGRGGPRAEWEALVGQLQGGGEPPLAALKSAYRAWSAALLRERGTLGDRLAAWAESTV